MQPADPVARRNAWIVTVVIAAAGALGYLALQDWLAGVIERDPVEARATLLAALSLGAWTSAVLMAALAAWCWHLGSKVRRAGRFPLPEAKLLRDTAVVEGAAAQARGRMLQICAVALMLLAVGLVAATELMSARLG